MIGNPCAGKLHARFDEGELEIGNLPLRQLSTLPKTKYCLRKDMHKELCVVRVNKSILNNSGVIIADGNASSNYVCFYPAHDRLEIIDKEVVFARYWNHENPIEKSKRAFVRCAEVLVPEKVPVEFISGAYVSCEESRQRLYDILI